jgi:pimeloyl-ACP methyl ester carboxylesterase
VPVPGTLPAWLSAADLDFYAGEFARTGFRGGLNWYRNIDRSWELLAPFVQAKVTVPALYMAGDRDLVVAFLYGPAARCKPKMMIWKVGLAHLYPAYSWSL